jgi:hypothetical protein
VEALVEGFFWWRDLVEVLVEGFGGGIRELRLCLGFIEPKFWASKGLVFWTWWPSGLALWGFGGGGVGGGI